MKGGKRKGAPSQRSNVSYMFLILTTMVLVVIVLLINVNEAVKTSHNDSNSNSNSIDATSVSNIHNNVDSGSSNSNIISNAIVTTTLTTTTTPTITTTATTNVIKKKKIAYAITVTKDGHFVDGALVLGYSALKVHDKSKGFHSEYEAELVAFVVPTVTEARAILQAYGWRVIEKTLPVALDEIENQEYAEKMKNSGCCGADEFLKLWAYTLTEYHRVVHLDMDCAIYNNMDELYSIDKEMLYTGDWNMKGGSPVPPAQGGFLVIRPSMERFEEFRAIIRKGDHGNKGWGGSHIGNFWGGQTIQGIIPYFYYSIHPGDALEVNRCIYNCMVDNPYRPFTEICLDGKPTCQDCRLQKFELVKTAHFTICQKPWTCTEHVNPKNKVLCEILHAKWFELRDEFEKETQVDTSYRQKSRYEKSLGMCRRYGDKAYLPIPLKSTSTSK